MDFWMIAAAVVAGVVVWKFFERFETAGDREELRLQREREEAERDSAKGK